jgi:hypothetical protein
MATTAALIRTIQFDFMRSFLKRTARNEKLWQVTPLLPVRLAEEDRPLYFSA